MNGPSGSFDSSAFIRKLSLRKKKWPDDYVVQKRKRSTPALSSPALPTGGLCVFFPPQPFNQFEVLTSHVLSELRAQFTDQLKCLDVKLDLDVTVMSELHEFYRRRALVEQEYSDALLKLANSLKHKHVNDTSK